MLPYRTRDLEFSCARILHQVQRDAAVSAKGTSEGSLANSWQSRPEAGRQVGLRNPEPQNPGSPFSRKGSSEKSPEHTKWQTIHCVPQLQSPSRPQGHRPHQITPAAPLTSSELSHVVP